MEKTFLYNLVVLRLYVSSSVEAGLNSTVQTAKEG